MARPRRYWLMKSEPSVFSIQDLAESPKGTTAWDGVRNYQARNFMREMTVGDQVLFYHSNADPPAVVGVAEVVRTAYPDDTQFDRRSDHYDPASDTANPRWDMVDIRYRRTFPEPITLDRLRQEPRLKGMVLLRKGSRLSVQPVTEAEWKIINTITGAVRGQEPFVGTTRRVLRTNGS
ncbi:MAG TPA: EVE domain-containing protein [Nitrospira sp.]|nr:EVE domain-containing protein [Nitrospira sp.]